MTEQEQIAAPLENQVEPLENQAEPIENQAGPLMVSVPCEQQPLGKAVEAFESQYIRCILNLNEGLKSKTAAMLGINRKTLYLKLKKYQVEAC